MSKLARLVVLISGSGSNLQALIDACQAKTLFAEIVLVVSNKRKAYGLTRAEDAGIPTMYLPFTSYKRLHHPRTAYGSDLADFIAPHQPDLIVLAGWMHILSPSFLNRYPNKIINLHPALPGQFDGTHAIERAFKAYQQGKITHSGCMVHYAIPQVDAGPVIASSEVPFLPNDTLEDYSERMHQAEHKLIVAAINKALQSQN